MASISDRLLKLFQKNKVDIIYDTYSTRKIGTIEIPDTIDETNAFTLANSVPEIYYPIDFHADRASKLRFFISKNGKEVKNTELSRFINNPNPLYSFSDLIYQAIFSYLSDGNIITYAGVPGIFKKITSSTIERLDILQPNLLELKEFYNIDLLSVSNVSKLIAQAKYTQPSPSKTLELDKLSIYNIDATKRTTSNVLSQSPLIKAQKSINTLLATYSARLNVYTNNGAAGYLVKKNSEKSNSIESVLDPITRDQILDDLNSRNGITGHKNLWGVSQYPLEFVKTLATINELQPLEETLENSIKIASIFQIPSGLVPRKDQPTFDNQKEQERSVWENATMSIVDSVCKALATSFKLIDIGYSISADYSTVSALMENEVQNQDILTKKLDNFKKILEMSPNSAESIDIEIQKLLANGKE